MVSPADAASALKQYLLVLDSRMAEMRATRARQEPLPYFVSAMFDHTTSVVEAEMAWLKKFIQKLEEKTNGKN